MIPRSDYLSDAHWTPPDSVLVNRQATGSQRPHAQALTIINQHGASGLRPSDVVEEGPVRVELAELDWGAHEVAPWSRRSWTRRSSRASFRAG
jgi:hypothetical protein